MPDIAIKLEDVGKTFKLPHEKYSSVKSLFLNFYRRKRTYEIQKALNGVSLEIEKGEFFGIIGRNGSGKSTLLKLIAGIYMPTKGEVKVNGSLTPFIELGVGFNPELTGRENVFLNGALLGFNRREIQAMYKDIVEFAELQKFMSQKLKNYSSGMQVRLAFSIAIRSRSDILLLDEVLAVGDAAFQMKCFDYFATLKKNRKTIILVSHNMQIVEQFCDRVALIEGGRVQELGESATIAALYEKMFLQEEARRIGETHRFQGDEQSGLRISSIKTLQSGKATKSIEAKKDFEIQLTIESKSQMDNLDVGINIKNHDRAMLIATGTQPKLGGLSLAIKSEKTITFNIQNILTNGIYTINVGVNDDTEAVPKKLVRIENAQSFTVHGIESNVKALTQPDVTVKID